jgi:glutathione S-transferase
MTLEIHGTAASRAIRPLWAATELGLPFVHVDTPYKGGATRTPEFLAINPNGHIPVVIDRRGPDVVVVWESMACALYLVRTAGPADGGSLAPATPREEAEALRWAFWAMSELEKDALTVLMHRMAMPQAQRRPELADAAEKRLRGPLAVLEAHLVAQQARGESNLAAARFTIADVCVASVANWLRPAGALVAQHPATQAWLGRCIERPAYRAAQRLGCG